MDYDSGPDDVSTLAKKLELETEIRAIKQEERSIQELFDVMLSLWVQMERLVPKELIKSSSYTKSLEENQITQFLVALRDEFEPYKRSLLSRDFVPSLQDVVSELKIEEERLRSPLGYFRGKEKLAAGDGDEPLSRSSSLSVETEGSYEPDFCGASSNYTSLSEECHSVEDSTTLKILTYNVCIWDVQRNERMIALGGLIQQHSPDIICFQEVTSDSYNIFKLASWWNEYSCSVSLQEAREQTHFCMQLSRLPVKSFSTKAFSDSKMGRKLCMADIQVTRGKSLIVATTHLESPSFAPPKFDQFNSQERIAEAKEALNFLRSYQNVIFGGDMNWDDEREGKFPLPEGWVDAWKELRPWLKGWTCDTDSNPMLVVNRPLKLRSDRFLTRLNDFKLGKMSMIGTEEIPGVSYLKEKKMENRVYELPVLPSDHYGLLLEIHSV